MKTFPSPPAGWEYVAWDTGLRCARCGVTVDLFAPMLSVQEQWNKLMAIVAKHEAEHD